MPPPPGYAQPGPSQPGYPQPPAGYVGGTPLGVTVPVEPRPARVDRAVGFGLVGALVAGAAWYGIVVLTDRQFVYLAIAFGFVIGYAVVTGAGKAGVSTSIIAVVITALGIVMSYYFIDRHIIVEALDAQGGYEPVPLFGSFNQVKEIVRLGFDAEKSQYLYSLVAVVAAGWVGARNR